MFPEMIHICIEISHHYSLVWKNILVKWQWISIIPTLCSSGALEFRVIRRGHRKWKSWKFYRRVGCTLIYLTAMTKGDNFCGKYHVVHTANISFTLMQLPEFVIPVNYNSLTQQHKKVLYGSSIEMPFIVSGDFMWNSQTDTQSYCERRWLNLCPYGGKIWGDFSLLWVSQCPFPLPQ